MTLVCSMLCLDCFVYWSYSYSYFIKIIDQRNADTFSEETCSSSAVFILLSPTYSIYQFLPQAFLFISLISLSFDSWIFCHLLPNLFLSFWLFLVLSWMLLMLVTMSNRISCATRLWNKNLGNIFFENIF